MKHNYLKNSKYCVWPELQNKNKNTIILLLLFSINIYIQYTFYVLTDSGVGAGIDSYYEYCLKAYILLGDETYKYKFNKVRDSFFFPEYIFWIFCKKLKIIS